MSEVRLTQATPGRDRGRAGSSWGRGSRVTSGVRLISSAAVVATGEGVVIRSDFDALWLTGADVGAFVDSIAPLLDGTRTVDQVVAALPRYRAGSVRRLLDSLSVRGLVDVGDNDPMSGDGYGPLLARGGQDAGVARTRLAGAGVIVVGDAPWAAAVSAGLLRAQVRRLHLIDCDPPAGVARSEMLDGAPSTRLTTSRADVVGGVLTLPGGDWDLVIGAVGSDELALLHALSKSANQRGFRSLTGYLEGGEVVIGPGVQPGRTACWNCARLRQLANGPRRVERHALHERMLDGSSARRDCAAPSPLINLVGHRLALEAIKLVAADGPSQLLGRVLIEDVVALTQKVHTVVRVPSCSVCGGDADEIDRETGAATGRDLAAYDDPEALKTRLDGWVGDRFGVVHRLVVHRADSDVGGVTGAVASVGRYRSVDRGLPGSELGSGKGLTATEAMVGAVGEAIERYSARHHDSHRICRARTAELTGDVFDPRRLGLYADSQYAEPGFEFARFDPDQPIDWVAGRWLDGGRSVWVPALASFLGHRVAPDEYFCQVTSNGLAAGRDGDDASMRSTMELIERDAFMLTWHAQLPARRLDPAGGGAEIGEVGRRLGAAGVTHELYLLSVGHDIPVILSVAFGDGVSWPGAVVALGADLDGRRAIRKAVLEQAQILPYFRAVMNEGDPRVPAQAADVDTLDDHARYYLPAERRDAFDFLRSDPGRTLTVAELPRCDTPSLHELNKRLRNGGLRVAIVDVTAPDIALSPFRVARAVGVDVAQIEFGFRRRRLANPRLQGKLNGSGLNPNPHPLA